MSKLEGRKAIVTGATKGLGAEIARRLAEDGAAVMIVSRHQEDCLKAAEGFVARGLTARGMACDVTKADEVSALIEGTVEAFGRLDILVNNAGVAVTCPAEELREEDWDRVLETNLKAVFLLSQAAGRQMIQQKNGLIINIASIFGFVGGKEILPYLCSKGGVIQMTRGLALEWAKYGLRVNAVAPGYVQTELNQELISGGNLRESLLKKTPLRRFCYPDEVAGAVSYLVSEEAASMTGAVLTLDGGWTAQ